MCYHNLQKDTKIFIVLFFLYLSKKNEQNSFFKTHPVQLIILLDYSEQIVTCNEPKKKQNKTKKQRIFTKISLKLS